MTNKDLIIEMIESLENNISNSPFIIDIPNAMKYIIYFNIYKKNNGLGGVGRLNGLTNLLSLVMNIKISEADSIIEVRNIFAHIFDNNDSTCIFEPNFSIDCSPL